MAWQRATRLLGSSVARLAQIDQMPASTIAFLPSRARVGDVEMPSDDVIASAYRARVSLSATGFCATAELSWDDAARTGRPFCYFAYGAAVSEVVIDTLAGEDRVLRAGRPADMRVHVLARGRHVKTAAGRVKAEAGAARP